MELLSVKEFYQCYQEMEGKSVIVGPSFRAEDSNTPRHVAEFWQVEPEIAFCDLNGIMDVIEAMSKHIIKSCLKDAREELEILRTFYRAGIDRKIGAECRV